MPRKKNYTDLSLYPSGMTVYEYSRYRKAKDLPGKDKRAVNSALDTGRIFLNEHGLIDPATADVDWFNYVNPNGRQSRPDLQPTGNVEGEVSDGEILDDREVQRRRKLAEMRHEEYKARLREIDVEVAEGKLLKAEDVSREVFDAVRTTRNNILNIPARLAMRVAAETDERKIEALLEKELRNALENMSKLHDE